MLSFHVKFVQTDRRTMVKQYVPDISIRGHKKTLYVNALKGRKCGRNIQFGFLMAVQVVWKKCLTLSQTSPGL